MRKHRIAGLLTAFALVLMMFGMLPEGSFRADAIEGNGTKNSPYIIKSYEDLYLLIGSQNSVLNSLSQDFYIKLGNNIIENSARSNYYFKLFTDHPRTVHLDLAGFTLSRIADTNDSAMFYIGSNVTLEIDDSVGAGKIYSTKLNNSAWCMFNVTNGGNLIINGGSFIDNSLFLHKPGYIFLCPIIYMDKSGNSTDNCYVTINGGYFESLIKLVAQYYGNLVINNGEFKQRSDVDGMPGLYSGILFDGNDYWIKNCVLTCNTSTTAITGSKLKQHMPSTVVVKTDNSTVTLNDKTDKIGGQNIRIYTREAIENIKWDGYSLSWDPYENSEKYGVQVEKLGSVVNDYSVVSNINTASAECDLTSVIKNNGFGVYRVLLGAHNKYDDLISLVTYSPTVEYETRKTVSEISLGAVKPRDGAVYSKPWENADSYEIRAYDWYRGTQCIGSAHMSSTDKFAEGQKYTLYCQVYVKDGYKFASDLSAKVNGQQANIITYSNRMGVTYTFTAGANNTLPQFDISIQEPRAGEVISGAVKSKSPTAYNVSVYNPSGSTENVVNWSRKDGIMLTIGSKFAEGKTYKVTFSLTQGISLNRPDGFLYLTGDTIVKVNGRSAVFLEKKGIYWKYEAEFTVPEQTVLKGDVDGNGKVNMRDYALLQKYLLDSGSVEIKEANADMDGDGKVNMRDYALLQKLLLKSGS